MTDIGLVLLIILIVLLLWRGPKLLPGLGAALGRAVRDTRRTIDEKFDGAGDRPDDR
jgi:Sec-independent protein translocase protein TatA